MAKRHQTAQHRLWRMKCKKRDGYKCVLTGSKKRLEVHHIRSSRYFPEDRHDVDNGITIDRKVHLLFHWGFMRGTRKKCDENDWKRFLYLWKYIQRLN